MHSLYEYVLVRDSYRYEMLTAMWGERQARVGWQSGKKLGDDARLGAIPFQHVLVGPR